MNNVLLSLSGTHWSRRGAGGRQGGTLPASALSPPLSLAGKSAHIWSHDLPGLFEQRRLQQQVPLSIPTNRLTQRIIPRWGPRGCRGEGRSGEEPELDSDRAHPGTSDLRPAVTLDLSLCLSEPVSSSVRALRTSPPLTPGLSARKKEVVDVKLLCRLWELWFLGCGANVY